MVDQQRLDGIVPAGELARRIEALQQALQDNDVDGALIVQKTDLFYFSSTLQQGWLYLPASGVPLLMVFKDFERAGVESPLAALVSVAGPKMLPSVLADHGYRLPQVLGLELDVLPANTYLQYCTLFPGARLVDASPWIRMVRAVKSPWEVEMIRRAARCSDRIFAEVPRLLAVGKTEIAAAADLEQLARREGHQGVVRMRMWGGELFYGHLMAGASAAVPSYLASPTGGTGVSPLVSQGAGWRPIERNEPILVDYVFVLNGYLVDQTRIFCIGHLPDDMMAGHEAMIELHQWAKIAARPGVSCGELYEQMVNRAGEAGFADGFMGTGERRVRFTGHGIGLELDEYPFIAKGQQMKLEAGMIVALEPKVIMPGRGVVGIENTHVVTENGLEQLTATPEGIIHV